MFDPKVRPLRDPENVFLCPGPTADVDGQFHSHCYRYRDLGSSSGAFSALCTNF